MNHNLTIWCQSKSSFSEDFFLISSQGVLLTTVTAGLRTTDLHLNQHADFCTTDL